MNDEMMELVIKIPKEYYELVMSKCLDLVLLDAFKNGTLLPKGHGKLKDIDAFITKVKADRKHSAYLRSWTADDVLNALDNSYAPTIIEGSDTDECNL